MARLAVMYSEYPAGGRLEVYGEEIADTRLVGGRLTFRADGHGPIPVFRHARSAYESQGSWRGLHRKRKESPMSSLRVDLITHRRRSLRPGGMKSC